MQFPSIILKCKCAVCSEPPLPRFFPRFRTQAERLRFVLPNRGATRNRITADFPPEQSRKRRASHRVPAHPRPRQPRTRSICGGIRSFHCAHFSRLREERVARKVKRADSGDPTKSGTVADAVCAAEEIVPSAGMVAIGVDGRAYENAGFWHRCLSRGSDCDVSSSQVRLLLAASVRCCT